MAFGFWLFFHGTILDVWQDSEFASEASNLRKKLYLRCFQGFEFAFVAINYFGKSVSFLFTKFDEHSTPYIKQYSILHGQIHMTLCSKYLLNNKNYNTCFLTIYFYRPCLNHQIFLEMWASSFQFTLEVVHFQ